MKFSAIVTVLAAAFIAVAGAAPVKDTNARRMAAGLPLLPPVRRGSGTNVAAHSGCTSDISQLEGLAKYIICGAIGNGGVDSAELWESRPGYAQKSQYERVSIAGFLTEDKTHTYLPLRVPDPRNWLVYVAVIKIAKRKDLMGWKIRRFAQY
ncbi:hypothetical protein F5146DRAFT_1122595 [Armillaria mellea]|nr:hypothetical protein F5146DRAFT_1122595 [Armillaria mellea]